MVSNGYSSGKVGQTWAKFHDNLRPTWLVFESPEMLVGNAVDVWNDIARWIIELILMSGTVVDFYEIKIEVNGINFLIERV